MQLSGSGFPGVEPPAGDGSPSVARGIAAGAVAWLIAFPTMFIVFVVAVVMRTTLLHKVMHVSVESSSDLHGGTALLAEALVAGATGLFGSAIAAYAALSLIKRGNRWAFFATAGAGFALHALGWSRAGPHAAGMLTFDAILGWLLAIAGLLIAETVVSDARRTKVRHRG